MQYKDGNWWICSCDRCKRHLPKNTKSPLRAVHVYLEVEEMSRAHLTVELCQSCIKNLDLDKDWLEVAESTIIEIAKASDKMRDTRIQLRNLLNDE